METNEPEELGRDAAALGSPCLFVVWFGGVLLLILLYVFIDIRLPSREVTPGVPLDQALHFLVFAMLAATAPLAFRRGGSALTAVLFLLALGLFLEITQYFIPSRHFSLYDALANALGLAVGAGPGFLARLLARPKPSGR